MIDLVYPFLGSLFRTNRGRKFWWFYFYFNPFVDDWQKGEEVFEIYACFLYLRGSSICVYAYMFCFANRRKRFYDCVLCLLLHLHTYLWAWVKGELLWSFTLIHAYITSWVLSSSKRARLLARRPITLVLMMINSCSYSTNDLVFN